MPVFTASGPISAFVSVPGGTCTITASDRPDVSVTVTSASPGGRHVAAATAVTFEDGRLRVTVPAVKVTYVLGTPRGRVHVDIRVPTGSSVDFESSSARLDVRGRLAALSAETRSGSVDVSSIAGSALIATKSGHITVGHATGTLESRSASGHITLGVGAGQATVRTGSGRVTVRVDDGIAVDSAIEPGSGAVRGDVAGSRESAEGRSGPRLRLAVTTASGRVSVSRA